MTAIAEGYADMTVLGEPDRNINCRLIYSLETRFA